ncbi:hypothetical protein [Streptomyces sp. NPDC093149]|uniref:hypothetical protein n=1 Tax=Streptomyces sp. NPDC093149 TaxID=3366031 RepID=UPI00380296DD
MLTRAVELLREVLRVAESRGARIRDEPCATDGGTADRSGPVTDEALREVAANG